MAPPPPRKRRLFDGAFVFLLLLALTTGTLAVTFKGPDALRAAARIVAFDAMIILPMITMGVVVGALFTTLVPRAIISRHLGKQAGFRGIALASLIGTVMPAGPFASFPLVLALGRSGASIGALIAFLTAWATVGLNRLVIWELPFMGLEFSMLRFLASLPVPLVAGVLADSLSNAYERLRVDWEDL